MFEIGRVIENPNDDFQGIEGLELLLFNMSKQYADTSDERLVINPMTKEGLETFYKKSFEGMGKEMISDDYKYFLKYMLDENCEFTCRIPVDQLENIRVATEEDIETYGRARKEFIEDNGVELEESED